MQKNTSITLGQHFDTLIAEQLNNGRYISTSDVIRAGLRLLEESETRLITLRKLASGIHGAVSPVQQKWRQNSRKTVQVTRVTGRWHLTTRGKT